jgi:hypothetical protein
MKTDTEATVELWQEQAIHNLQAAEDFKLELADARREICELEKQLASEAALADRLAEALDYYYSEDSRHHIASNRAYARAAWSALAAWKEARSECR